MDGRNKSTCELSSRRDVGYAQKMEGSVRRNIALKLKEPAARVSSPGPSSPSSRSATQGGSSCINVIIINVVSLLCRNPACPCMSVDNTSDQTAGRFSLHQGKELRWDQRQNLIGRPVINPLLHICEVCDLPVLIYGRMVRPALACLHIKVDVLIFGYPVL